MISKNYLVFLSDTPEIDYTLLEDKQHKSNHFLILGYSFQKGLFILTAERVFRLESKRPSIPITFKSFLNPIQNILKCLFTL